MRSEEALVAACLRNEPLAFREFVERFQGDVSRLCYRMLGNKTDAEDVAQESFLRIFKYLRRWDSSRTLRPWILQVTANRCRTWLSSQKATWRLDPEIEVADKRSPNSGRESLELHAEIVRAVGHLREDYRLVFLLFHDQSMDYAAIAEVMEKPIGTIKTWLHRARIEVLERLRSRGMLEECDSDVEAK